MSKKERPSRPSIQVFSVNSPKALERDISTRQQTRFDEETIIWGEDDALPLRILQAVEQSPTTTSCLDVVSDFIAGDGFTDPGLEGLIIDTDGTTLLQHHQMLSEYLSRLEGFSVNFKFNNEGKIVSAYNLPIESNRFVKPGNDRDKQIRKIKYNPYFGTAEYKQEYTDTYDTWSPKDILNQYNEQGNLYKGQVFYQGSVRSLYKFYPVAKYWTGKDWIYVDGKIQGFHKNNLDNGFFQSVYMQVIGDPNAWSTNPRQMKEQIGEDGSKRKVATKTVGEEFKEQMSTNFSGVDKAGTVFVKWLKNHQEAIDIQAFPTNTNFDVLAGTFTDSIRGICIATKVPAILANLPQQASSLGSDGNAFQKATELMQSRAKKPQQILENYYNNILLPNFYETVGQKVKIKDYKPVSTQITIEDKFWDVLQPNDKKEFIRLNIPGITVSDNELLPNQKSDPETLKAQAALRGSVGGVQGVLSIQQGVVAKTTSFESGLSILKIIFGFSDSEARELLGQPKTEDGQIPSQTLPLTTEQKTNELIRNLTGRQLQGVQRLVRKFNKNELTYEQASQLLKNGFGFSDDDVSVWLVTNEEE